MYIHACKVGCKERRFGRTVRVEPDVVEPPFLACLKYGAPGFKVGRRITGIGKAAALHSSA